MECTVSWTGAATGTRSGMGFVAETGSGHVVTMDGAPDANNPANGGQNLAARPLELLLAGTGGIFFWLPTIIRNAGVKDVLFLDHHFPMEFCDDCGAPLFPNREAELVHAEMPEQPTANSQVLH